MAFKTAQEAIAWIHGEGNLRPKGEKYGLTNITELLKRLGDPQKKYASVHVAGTNGKGSTCAYIDSALRHAGLKVGLYTSPYLCRYNERIHVCGRSISDDLLLAAANEVHAHVSAMAENGMHSTAFEIGTAVAFLAFAMEKLDIAVIEVGLGGRLDSTNVIVPEVSVITAIGLDHTEMLGNTIELIAGEKAGIIKEGVPVVVYPVEQEALDVLKARCAETNSELTESGLIPTEVIEEGPRGNTFTVSLPASGDLRILTQLIGHHQIANARLAACALDILAAKGFPIKAEDITEGLKVTKWPGRLEWLDDRTLIDGAHNPQGAGSLAGYVQSFCRNNKCVLITGMMHDKDIDVCAKILAPCFDEIIATRIDYPRAATTEYLAEIYRREGAVCLESPTVAEAIALGKERAGKDGIIVIAGSLYVAGEARILLTGGEEI